MGATFRQQDFYLVLHPVRWEKLGGRLSTKQPTLGPKERALRISVSVPDALFSIPTIRATVTVPESAVSHPEIPAQVLDNVREVIEQQTGLKVQVAVIQAEG